MLRFYGGSLSEWLDTPIEWIEVMAGHIPSIRTRERLEAVAATMAGTHPSEMRQTIEEWEADADPNAASSSELSEQAFDLRMQMLGFSELEITQQVPD